MKPQVKPTAKRGERNIRCPHYNECLNHAVEYAWRTWSCSECLHKELQFVAESEWDGSESEPYYHVSSDVSLAIDRGLLDR
jgi:hypothetical protein